MCIFAIYCILFLLVMDVAVHHSSGLNFCSKDGDEGSKRFYVETNVTVMQELLQHTITSC